jgi:adenylate kinase
MNHLVLFGAPYSGKGTQSKLLSNEFSFVHLSVGDLLRNEIKLQSSVGKSAIELVQEGKMVDNKIIIELMNKRIAGHPIDTKFIFDGIPRTLEQAKDFNIMIESTNFSTLKFIFLIVGTKELLRRASERAINEKRIDDQNMSTIKNRIRNYKDQTLPVIKAYSATSFIYTVNGEQSILQVYNDIRTIVNT